ncbi:hypothetical protein CGGC5_v008551 [Colletotrichum fructicola Nara gc5]|uniref:Copper transport protein n=1 Tax=Colletotrichum fructicola (strain Nara gc5) TaxID=1213859 RepID=A0A7J6J4H1_COLFN|nr:hypothetical protein CGGC5_v008551 [Colletotrichum fructicola Nara gc5]
MDMTEHNHGHSSDGDGSMTMPVVFHTAMSTSLFSETWTPRTTGQYADWWLGMTTRRPEKKKGMISEANIRLGRAVYEVLIALLGYLLMLAVMSMNVGYFVSILVGVFLGTLGLGGIARDSTFDHCS